MFMCLIVWSSVINLDLFWKQSFLIACIKCLWNWAQAAKWQHSSFSTTLLSGWSSHSKYKRSVLCETQLGLRPSLRLSMLWVLNVLRFFQGAISFTWTLKPISQHFYPLVRWYICEVWQTDRLTDWQTDRLTDWQTDRLTDWQTDRLTDWQTDRLTDWQSVCQTARLSVIQPDSDCLFVCMYVCLSLCVCLSVSMVVFLFISQSGRLSVCLNVFRPSVYLSIHTSVRPSVLGLPLKCRIHSNYRLALVKHTSIF